MPSQNERTLLAKQALTEGDLEEFGLLLNASHRSLKEDYEVTGIELDTLVACARTTRRFGRTDDWCRVWRL